ncbi:hypothetical protein OHS59_16175 [Streptomyces sp. NBC_00414]|uniref:hypothetical protein n=1 Tax=Streptomyces sp. NBC_00414 TaxID=2975739 RepID=UPI002E1EED86
MATKIHVTGALLGSVGLRDNNVTATLVDLNGTPRIGFVDDVESELVAKEATRTDSAGSWTLSLYGNADIESDYGDTLYRITEGPGFNQYGSNAFYIGVPVSGGPYWVADLRVSPPGGAVPESFAVVSVDTRTGVVDLSDRYLGLGGGTLTGALTLDADPTNALHAATKQYVDAMGGGGGPTGGPFLALAGGTMSGAIVLPGNPSTALQAAPKQYVDASVAAVSGTYVDTAGDTMTGALVLSGAPTIGLHAATKTYVDNETVRATGAEALLAPKASPTFTGTVSGITKAMVGLGNVDNTSDTGKPVSTAQQTALDLKANLASPTFTGTVSGITKSMVGLGSVDNTSDTGKPVSTAQQTALDLKANLASPTFTGTVNAAAVTTSGTVTVGGNLSVTGIGRDLFAVKTGDESVTSNATVQNDDELVVSVAANATYLVEVVAVWTNGGGGFRADFLGPTGATMVWTDNDGAGVQAIGTDVTFSATTGTSMRGTLITSGTSGTLQFRWAQNTSNAGATVLKAGCSMYLRRVA